MTDTSDDGAQKSAFARQWNYKPDVPIQSSPLFVWPPKPVKIANWIKNRWFVFGENLILVGLATLTWFYFQPALEDAKTIEFGWIAWMFVRNFILISIVAGGLHFFLHIRKTQEDKLKFDPRELNARGKTYTWNSQVLDNMFWTLTSGVFFWTAFEALMFWGMANGYVPILPWVENPVWFIALLFLTPMWISFHFYWVHRWLHWPPLYRLAHALHHRNTNIGPWSGLSMHPFEHLLFLSSVLIHWIVAAHPIHILFHMQHQALTAVTSHAGYDALLVKDKEQLALGNFHHQMHHRYFECNYGNLEVPWDKAFGTFHDGTEDSHEKMKEHRRKILAGN